MQPVLARLLPAASTTDRSPGLGKAEPPLTPPSSHSALALVVFIFPRPPPLTPHPNQSGRDRDDAHLTAGETEAPGSQEAGQVESGGAGKGPRPAPHERGPHSKGLCFREAEDTLTASGALPTPAVHPRACDQHLPGLGSRVG